MDENLIIIAQRGLNELLKALHGDNLTCYFYNPFSEIYWLFHKEGKFKFPCQMHGPLTHPDQRIRMEGDLQTENINTGVTIFKNSINSSLATRILAEESFALREGISSTIRIRILPVRDREKKVISDRKEPFVVIFINYKKNSIPTKNTIEEIVRERQTWLEESLLKLVEQPKIEQGEAWRLRSMILNFHRKLAQILVGQPIKENQESIYNYIVQQTRELIELRHGAKNLLCTLSIVNNNNKVQVVASSPKGVTKSCKSDEGIVEYVARTGRIYYVKNIQEYKKMPVLKSRPLYVACKIPSCNRKVISELACPLIIQGKVVGVLNLEADQPRAYEDNHILLLYQFASNAALAVRQIELFRDLDMALKQNRQLLSCVNITDKASTLSSIYHATLQAATDLGYECQIWDRIQKKWHRILALESWPEPRSNGYTNWVINNKKPIALIDLQKDQVNFDIKAGVLGNDMLFNKWEEFPKSDILPEPNPASHDLVRNRGDIICEFGFPIELRGKSKPSAVLWVRCNRYFQSLLTDESWCLSLFCRMATEALQVRRVIEKTKIALATSENTQSELIRYHFGPERQESVRKLLKSNPDALVLKKASNIIILSIDLRGSTKLSAKCISESNFQIYKEFISKFHRIVREAAISKGGVMDKTIGDGAHILFNIYKPELLDIRPYDNIELAKKQAIDCAYLIEESLNELKLETIITSFNISKLCLGAGLTIGDAFVGGINSEIRGYEYSAYSHTVNHAGKLVSEARTTNVLKWLKGCIVVNNKVYRINSFKNIETVSLTKIQQIITSLEKECISVLFTDSGFEKIDGCESYIIPTDKEDGSTQIVYFLTRF